jgi:GNAT superfamily N-acetyltransferase
MIERLFYLEESDATQIIELGREFYKLTGLRGTFHGKTFIDFWNGFLGHGRSSMWVYRENGRILGTIGVNLTMSLFDGFVIADEAFWFVHPHHRGTAGVRLFFAMKEWAERSGAQRILMGRMLQIDPENEKVQKFYERHEFKPFQTQYYLDLVV